MSGREKQQWQPYAVGAGIGALSWLTFLTARNPLGVTTAFESTAAGLAQRAAPSLSGVNAYLARTDEVPKLGWEWMLDGGIILGSLLSARLSGDRRGRTTQKAWKRRFGRSPSRRYAGAFLGGAMMMFGARMAKGCTSGHALSGTMQLAASSWVFSPLMALTSILTARALFIRRRR